ncbi:hypothetical protein XH92_36310 [Bradyrhizobium sp. CCBAU 53421]|nr:hypothetical protein XH92_36310 [Bradyrhizobium sp. CCBAU 53421]
MPVNVVIYITPRDTILLEPEVAGPRPLQTACKDAFPLTAMPARAFSDLAESKGIPFRGKS